ncbi:MAG: nitroreductase family protein [Spirochaetales bacterium]|nr:nitroreductase family protein [Spirochaetales bacterium]
MNETLTLIEQRRSLRSYAERPVESETVSAIFRAALRAPTAGAMMLYSIIEIADQTLKDKLAVSCDHQPFIAKAPLVLLFAADYQRWYDLFLHTGIRDRCAAEGSSLRLPEEGDLLLACCDTLIAAENAVIAAESLGLGSCYIGDILENYEFHRDLLQLPKYVLPVTLLCFGYPKAPPAGKPVPRFPQEYIHFKNNYRRLEPKELDDMASRVGRLTEGTDPAEEVWKFYRRKFDSDFSREMSRSVRGMLESWKSGI